MRRGSGRRTASRLPRSEVLCMPEPLQDAAKSRHCAISNKINVAAEENALQSGCK